jgi:prepilin-type processing-associated H-X9-DG protein
VIDVPWDLLRPGAMARRCDGSFGRAVDVERHPFSVNVLFADGRRERRQPMEKVQILARR